MHNRLAQGVESREIGLREAVVLVPVVACILGLALYPRPDHEARRRVGGRQPRRRDGSSSQPAVRGRPPGLNQLRAGLERDPMSAFTAPHIDYAGLSPIIALSAGFCIVLMGGLVSRGDRQRAVVSVLTLGTLAVAAGLCIWQWTEGPKPLVAGALRLDDLGLAATLIAIFAAAFVVPLSWREDSLERPVGPAGHAEFQALLISSVLGMTILAQAQNVIALFIGLELLSIPLYVMCGSALRHGRSLESGLKYLIVGSLGSATLLYGLAFLYGGAGSTDFQGIRDAVGSSLGDDPLILVGIGLTVTGLAFKTSIAPFHQWTPDVYQGAPTPVTAFMAVGDEGGSVRGLHPLLPRRAGARGRQLAARTRCPGGDLDRGRQYRRPRAGLAEAAARLFGDCPGRIHARGLVAASTVGVNALVFYPRCLRGDEPGRVRGHRHP